MGMCYVPMYYSYLDSLEPLASAELGNVIRALLQYANGRQVPELSEKEQVAFSFMRTKYDMDVSSYEDKVEKLRDNGRKGGAPKGNQNARKAAADGTPKAPPKTTKTTNCPQEKGKEKGKEKEKGSSSSAPAARPREEDEEDLAFERILTLYQEGIHDLTPGVIHNLRARVRDVGPELVEAVVRESIDHDARGWNYLRRVFKDCRARHITTVDQYRAYCAEMEAAKAAKAGPARSDRSMVDRPEHSGVDILKRRPGPLRLKREEGA
ncbi:MAG: DnaD domain protein [Oscillospiraceae bacterium]|nr:DnaD domain protein [Oscillospiraceae bacterium]